MKQVALKDICIKGSSPYKQKELLADGRFAVYGASGIAGYLDSYAQETNYIGIVKDGSGIGRVDFYPAKTSLIGTMQYILPKNGYDIRYIGYCLKSLDLSKYKQGAAIPHIYFKDYGERIVRIVEDEKEQQRIVERLDSAFADIDELKANAEKQLSEARALFQKALAKAMEPKDGWEEKKFGEVCFYHKEQGIYKNTRYIGMENMESGTGNILGFMNSNDVLSSSFKFKKGEVLYGRLRPYLKKVYIAEFDGCCSTEVFPIYSDVIDAGFIKYWFLTDGTTKRIVETSAGCRMPRGNMNQVKVFDFSFPPLSEQQRIVARLDSLSAHVRELEEVNKKLIAECDALKQALLRKVFE